ncbi:MAG: bifunctional fucokinase/L-fucose-1-P-guanylyltransferase [Clostridia bacterium]|nr:bifunctional fucokinase/L-fucose-1-P-guanylyltransferase [Clostridia bacterium]
MAKSPALFLAQSYMDTWDDYERSLNREGFPVWDYIILTASNENQAEGFRSQINERLKLGLLPAKTKFAVIPDRDGKRVGSGGATLGVLKYVAEQIGKNDFSGLRILVIHSGGDSKRVPQYSALGKLFSPVPHKLPNGRSATLFDEFMMAMSSVPARIREGMVLLSGDVLLLFNPLQIDYSGNGAAAISFKEKVEIGKNHGVFLRGEDGCVQKFLHKQTVESLTEIGAVNDNGKVDIDTGAVIFSAEMLKSLYSLVSDSDGYDKYVNEKVRLSLYGDFLYPLATDSTLEKFLKEKPEGEFCDELYAARKVVWEVLRPYRMKLLRLSPAKFIHFGTTAEILELMSGGVDNYKELNWSNHINSSITKSTAGYNSVLSDKAKIGKNCYLEVSYVHSKAKIGDNVLLSYIDIHDEVIPSDVVIHGLKQKDGKFVARIYGVKDNPKENLLFGKPLEKIFPENIWCSEDRTLWSAEIYPECETIEEAVKEALNIYEAVNGNGDMEHLMSLKRKSLQSGFNEADPEAIIAWDNRMQELVRMDGIAKLIRTGRPATEAKDILKADALTPIQEYWLSKRLLRADFSEKIRLFYYLGKALGGQIGTEYITKSFNMISEGILKETVDNLKYNENCKIAKDKLTVKLPLRVNWGGGWSDTPPYCNENGGAVLNAAILLNGEKPVEVTLERVSELKIVFDSRDMDVHGEFSEIAPLQQTGDPYDVFALQKAALLACGVIPQEGGKLEDILTRLGGGFVMHSEVTNVPKGSGLGTSSILSAACVKAIFEFMGIPHTEDDLYRHVLAMEQIMSTGGGWQDQVGGVVDGVKFVSAMPGIIQDVKVSKLDIPEKAMKELNERFILIYTGQRRLARNLLRDVVGRYIGNEPESIYALNEIQRIAALMRFELERGNIDEFAKLLDRHWELSKMVDSGSTNTLIDQIFASVQDYTAGRLVCGAGGGGFLQVILKRGVTVETVRKTLRSVFQDSDVDIWDCEIV